MVVTNPTCAACRANLRNLERVIQDYSNIYVQITLAASPQDEGVARKVARQILDLPAEEMALALNSWYEVGERHFEKWSTETGGDHFSKSVKEQLELYVLWLEPAGVGAAPACFLNSVELPKFYQLRELSKLCAAFENMGIAQSHPTHPVVK